ncbi:efflux RND transporter periplasmic adaptor subunit [Bradyrhizobium betae]|jgi:Cu(I)/Ag(I) efflux system membrane fusion protein|uniref:Efflux RND transporter periplasmic adaptor subunit n=1 Tax=Bradyrhizobium betae TaxID=244734 RepID=A0A5P6PGP1_9BRAD|nr:efflux RND transporter periplasmic adaptor subunit [Bradyrhizobium betae]MCS3731019.1 Cu(I)/Ag(I) efflux system membrane fusion protein [Bradyrhizobium betae]QFI77457.1 efflux RND transporter periplasmic adaptor subunit [Bradyrhizobium betae]
MSRAVFVTATVAALIAAAGGGFIVGRAQHSTVPMISTVTAASAKPGGPPIYFQDPDNKPFYSLTPRKTSDGRDYHAVPAGSDVSFEDAPAPVAATAPVERKIKYYRNPMGLPDTSPTPKKDPMGMDYIPVYEGEDSDDGSVKLSPGKIQRTGVQSEPAALRVIHTLIRAPGTIQLDERRASIVSFRFEGFIESVENVTTGEHVHKGQPLMRVYSPSLSSAAAEYLSALNGSLSAQALKGARRRLENLGMPGKAIADIERTREISLSVAWPAPQDGDILERTAVNGMRAAPGDVLFRIVDHRVVWVLVDIAERDLAGIAIGQKVDVRPRAFSGRSFSGKVALIYPHLNAQTRTARVRIELENPDGLLRPDMYVDAAIDTGNPQPVLAIPESAVLDTGTRQSVLVDKGQGRFEPHEVKLGHRGGGYVEVREGLTDGEPVVTSANFLIDAESNLKAALKGFSEAGTQP